MALRAVGRDCSQLLRSGAGARVSQSSRGISSAMPRAGDKRFVRIAGATNYASSEDIKLFLRRNGVDVPENVDTLSLSMTNDKPLPVLIQGQSDVFQNHSIWVYDAGSHEEAAEISSKLAGRIVGMKLAKASAIDSTLVSSLFRDSSAHRRRTTLRRRMSVIEPSIEERGRTVLCTHLEPNMNPRAIWGFFSTFDVMDVRMLRRSGVASVVFRTKEEAVRAIRERSNVSIQNRCRVHLKMFE